MKLAFISKTRTENLGDLCCSAQPHFGSNGENASYDNDDPWETTDANVLVFGGGGLLHNVWLERMNDFAYSDAARSKTLIAWSIGINQHGATTRVWPKFLDRFAMVGLRDWGNPWRWVPCVSCMHPAFDGPVASPAFQRVIYEHRDIPIDTGTGEPRRSNHTEGLAETLAFLASGQRILTSSYHGAFWGLLLGREVVLWSNWSNKFAGLESPHVTLENEILRAEPGYLQTCRKANDDFSASVGEWLQSE